MRGKHVVDIGFQHVGRIIPAHAGQTLREMLSSFHTTDHPRACGANRLWARIILSYAGSSPRMRGKHAGDMAALALLRIIPAHAGQTKTPTWPTVSAPDHPRACGANPGSEVKARWSVGSSPRMRGKPIVAEQRVWVVRIIPAHAGQTCEEAVPERQIPDHPRACGANVHGRRPCVIGVGSSPRMRGKRLGSQVAEQAVRIIPAHAGQTRRLCCRTRPAPDHPRACGANA